MPPRCSDDNNSQTLTIQKPTVPCGPLKDKGPPVEKSAFTRDYRTLTVMLRELRRRAGMTQEELAEKVGQTQSYISKWERGELRLDVVQVRELCLAMRTTLSAFANEYEARLAGTGSRRRARG
jgi:ribosome-binding protein aMBF1 (putative translation factor)